MSGKGCIFCFGVLRNNVFILRIEHQITLVVGQNSSQLWKNLSHELLHNPIMHITACSPGKLRFPPFPVCASSTAAANFIFLPASSPLGLPLGASLAYSPRICEWRAEKEIFTLFPQRSAMLRIEYSFRTPECFCLTFLCSGLVTGVTCIQLSWPPIHLKVGGGAPLGSIGCGAPLGRELC